MPYGTAYCTVLYEYLQYLVHLSISIHPSTSKSTYQQVHLALHSVYPSIDTEVCRSTSTYTLALRIGTVQYTRTVPVPPRHSTVRQALAIFPPTSTDETAARSHTRQSISGVIDHHISLLGPTRHRLCLCSHQSAFRPKRLCLKHADGYRRY